MKVEKIATRKANFKEWIVSKTIFYADGDKDSIAVKYDSGWNVIARHYVDHYPDKVLQFGYIEIYSPNGRIVEFKVEKTTFRGLKNIATKILNDLKKQALKNKIRKEMV